MQGNDAMTTARKRRMKTCGAIRTTFAPCRCWSIGSARKRRCHAREATSWKMVTTILRCVMVKTEDCSRVMTRRRREESLSQVLSPLDSDESSSNDRRQRGNSRRKHATGRRFASFRRIYEPLSISRLYSANDSTSLESENSFEFDINAAVRYYHDWLRR